MRGGLKKNKKTVGDFGEGLAAEYLMKKGYEIIARNLQISYQEIDIIASIGEKTVFVEVKTRLETGDFSGEEALGPRKLANLKKAILAYSRPRGLDLDCLQLDLIVINIEKSKKIAKIKHYIEIV